MNSQQDPRYHRNGRPNLRFMFRYPRAWLRMKLLWRWRRLLRQLHVTKPPPPVEFTQAAVPGQTETDT